MAYDAGDGLVYWGAGPNLLVMIDPVNDTVVGTISVDGAQIPYGEVLSSSYGLSYDAATNTLLMPSSAGDLLVVDPTTGGIERVLSLPAPAVTVATDEATNQVFVNTEVDTVNTTSVEVFNAATFALESTITIPSCVQGECAAPNGVNAILFDPAHGDAYFLSIIALLVLNLTTMSVVASAADYGNGAPETAALASNTDRIFGTYEPLWVGPGFLITLSHGARPFLATLLWLPTSVALVLLAGAVGTVLAAVRPVRTLPEDYSFYAPLWPTHGKGYDRHGP